MPRDGPEQYLAQPRQTGPSPPRTAAIPPISSPAPDSLHLEAHVPGNQYYRFPERPVRYGTRMRLRYWYLIAAGTEGECRARIAQYKDTPTAWKVLTDGAHEECLTRSAAGSRSSRSSGPSPRPPRSPSTSGSPRADVGEMWIDDVRLEPIAGATPTSP